MEQKALVVINGVVRELPVGDTLAGVPGVSSWKEPVSVLNGGVPETVFTSTGDTVMNDAT